MKHNINPVPQMRVHTNLIAGESVGACQQNLDYWTKQLQKKVPSKKQHQCSRL